MEILPFVYAYCDTGYWEKYGKALANSIEAHGHDGWVECSGRAVTDEQSKIEHSHFRYKRLPELLERHEHVLMLDVDSIIRKPAIVPDGRDVGIVYDANMADWLRCVNGGCVYIRQSMMPLALRLAEKMNGQHWFDDQAALFRQCVKRGNFRRWIIDGDFFSWRENPQAAIWTGKGKEKFRPGFIAEVGKYR